MGDWKVGDKAYVPVEFVGHMTNNSDCNLKFKTDVGGVVYVRYGDVVRAIPSAQPAPVDVSKIKVGDVVTVRVEVDRINFESPDGLYFLVVPKGYKSLSFWLRNCDIASHTPRPRPSTLAEFDQLPAEVRDKFFEEIIAYALKRG